MHYFVCHHYRRSHWQGGGLIFFSLISITRLRNDFYLNLVLLAQPGQDFFYLLSSAAVRII